MEKMKDGKGNEVGIYKQIIHQDSLRKSTETSFAVKTVTADMSTLDYKTIQFKILSLNQFVGYVWNHPIAISTHS
jgi:hypothetical protein